MASKRASGKAAKQPELSDDSSSDIDNEDYNPRHDGTHHEKGKRGRKRLPVPEDIEALSDSEKRKIQRRDRNRKNAQASRARKAQRLEELEIEVAIIKQENDSLRDALTKALEELEQLKGHNPAGCPLLRNVKQQQQLLLNTSTAGLLRGVVEKQPRQKASKAGIPSRAEDEDDELLSEEEEEQRELLEEPDHDFDPQQQRGASKSRAGSKPPLQLKRTKNTSSTTTRNVKAKQSTSEPQHEANIEALHQHHEHRQYNNNNNVHLLDTVPNPSDLFNLPIGPLHTSIADKDYILPPSRAPPHLKPAHGPLPASRSPPASRYSQPIANANVNNASGGGGVSGLRQLPPRKARGKRNYALTADEELSDDDDQFDGGKKAVKQDGSDDEDTGDEVLAAAALAQFSIQHTNRRRSQRVTAPNAVNTAKEASALQKQQQRLSGLYFQAWKPSPQHRHQQQQQQQLDEDICMVEVHTTKPDFLPHVSGGVSILESIPLPPVLHHSPQIQQQQHAQHQQLGYTGTTMTTTPFSTTTGADAGGELNTAITSLGVGGRSASMPLSLDFDRNGLLKPKLRVRPKPVTVSPLTPFSSTPAFNRHQQQQQQQQQQQGQNQALPSIFQGLLPSTATNTPEGGGGGGNSGGARGMWTNEITETPLHHRLLSPLSARRVPLHGGQAFSQHQQGLSSSGFTPMHRFNNNSGHDLEKLARELGINSMTNNSQGFGLVVPGTNSLATGGIGGTAGGMGRISSIGMQLNNLGGGSGGGSNGGGQLQGASGWLPETPRTATVLNAHGGLSSIEGAYWAPSPFKTPTRGGGGAAGSPFKFEDSTTTEAWKALEEAGRMLSAPGALDGGSFPHD